MNSLLHGLVKSWSDRVGTVNTTKEIRLWIEERNAKVDVSIKKIALEDSDFWFYDQSQGAITNRSDSFFKICGLQNHCKDSLILEQPIILQDEIGYLGIICKEVNGVLNFLMQAKIEPGNVNKVQISPTIQATKSNFLQKHGGKKPLYLDYFLNASRHKIIVDQLQSEQSSRFFKKRNRNIIILVDDDIEVLPSHKWVTLGQLKELMKLDNIVNMDTRTVLSCIPFCMVGADDAKQDQLIKYFNDPTFFHSVFGGNQINCLPEIFQYINNYKMFNDSVSALVPLYSLKSWRMKDGEFICNHEHSFKVIFCNIKIEGREVQYWTQPLFEAVGFGTFGLFMCEINGIKNFLIRAFPEVGCFDKLELGPSVHLEPNDSLKSTDAVTKLFMKYRNDPEHVKYDVILSEEGGRFYNEQNYNVILEIQPEELSQLPEGYFWVDYKTLNQLTQVNNCLNIQLRNLLSLLEV